MHELSISMSIIDMAEEESDRRGGVRVDTVHLRVGALAGVVKAALLSSWELACAGTRLEGARLAIEDVPIEVYCPACAAPRVIDSIQWFICPECHGPVSEVTRGRDLEVFALELDE